jgi:hypothetical protein
MHIRRSKDFRCQIRVGQLTDGCLALAMQCILVFVPRHLKTTGIEHEIGLQFHSRYSSIDIVSRPLSVLTVTSSSTIVHEFCLSTKAVDVLCFWRKLALKANYIRSHKKTCLKDDY